METKLLRLNQVVLPLAGDEADLPGLAAAKLGCRAEQLGRPRVIRRSVDARARRGEPVLVHTLEFILPAELAAALASRPDAELVETEPPVEPPVWTGGVGRPLVIGAGPAGLMAALALARAGARPILCERGGPLAERRQKVARFWQAGELDPECNTLYGPGGAGLFSDGKLTSRSKDRRRLHWVLEALVGAGAPEAILTEAEPHLGSDALVEIVARLLEQIAAAGGEMRYHSRLEGLQVETTAAGPRLSGAVIGGLTVPATACLLAVGHSARDVYLALARAGASLQAKAFAVGVRAELPQARIDRAQWGEWAGHPRLGAASFRLTRPVPPPGRACYTFCMCPGGQVIACASEAGGLTTNGMSLSARAGRQGNAACLIPVTPADFSPPACAGWGELDGRPSGFGSGGGKDTAGQISVADNEALAGLEFQRRLEEATFRAGGGDYALPACRLTDFLQPPSGKLGEIPDARSWLRSRSADLRAILPEFLASALADALWPMLRKLRGAVREEVLLYGLETRSSSPVRVLRDETTLQSAIAGLYPVGEGAGYAGGIVSAAIDGLRAAETLLAQTCPAS